MMLNFKNIPKMMHGKYNAGTTSSNNEISVRDLVAFNQTLIEASPVGIASYNGLTGECISANAAFARIIGGDLGKVLNQNFRRIESWRESGLLIGAEQVLSTGITSQKEIYFISTFLKEVWCEYTFVKFYNSNQPHLLMLINDITERKSMEIALRQSEARLKEAQEIAKIGSWDIDLIRDIHIWSDELYRLFGIDKTAEPASIELFQSFMHPDDRAGARYNIIKAINTRTNLSYYFRFIKRDGLIHHGYLEWRFEFDRRGTPVRLFGIVKDITEQRTADDERTALIADITQRNKNLEHFSYIVSHNLRAPVANILGLSSVLLGDDLKPQMKNDIMNGLAASVNKLDEVIKDLTYILKTKQALNEKKEMVLLNTVIDEIRMSLGEASTFENISFEVDFSAVNEMLTIKSYIHSIFYNLITNSLKYRKRGQPLKIIIKGQKLVNKIMLLYRDNGMGIDLARRGHEVFGLYKRFHVDCAEGKGMGLYMVKSQVETLGGRIIINSEVNKGTEFRIAF